MSALRLLQKRKIKKASAYIFFAALAFFIFFTVQRVVAAVQDYQAVEMKINIKQADLTRKSQNLLHYESNLTRQQELTRELANLHQRLLPRPDIHEQVLKMDELLAAHRLTAMDFSVSPLVPVILESQANVYFSTFSIRAMGSSENVVQFVQALGKEDPLMLVESVAISPEQDAYILNIQFQLVYLTDKRKH